MTQIKLINKDTDLTNLRKPLDWDVVINNKPYYVVRINGYVHTIGGRWGDNDYWAYPRDEMPTYENLIEFSGEPVCWGIEYKPHNYTKTKWDECEALKSSYTIITRNGKKFCDAVSIDRAKVMIEEFIEHPMNLGCIDFDKKMIGTKVWWRSQPGIITSYINEQACVIIKPDGINKFDTPAEFKEGYSYEGGNINIKADILDKHIWWFRN